MINFSVQCICLDDRNRPKEIPESKWPKRLEKYTIFFTVLCLPQKEIGVMLAEIELTEKELPYEYFLLKRFGFTKEELPYEYFLLKRFGFTKEEFEKLNVLIKACTDADFSVEELLKQTELIEVN